MYIDSTTTDNTMFLSNHTIFIDRDLYEKDLKRRQEIHLNNIQNVNWRPCLHDGCRECLGTGIKRTGGPCIHNISCPCPKCSPSY